MTQSGKTLSMHNDAIWKGTYTNNGTLLKIHEFSYTIGYSELLSPDGKAAGKAKFGNAVFYDAAQRNNRVYAGAPTVEGAKPKFAGIIVREPGIASGYPAVNDEVASFQKGLLVKDGLVVYKSAPVKEVSADTSESVNVYENAEIGSTIFASATDGQVYFSNDGAKLEDEDAKIGFIVELNPDDKSVTVKIEPAMYING